MATERLDAEPPDVPWETTSPDSGSTDDGSPRRLRPNGARIARISSELRMRRRRLDAYQNSPDWPGKDPTWMRELASYDVFLLQAAAMLEVAVPEDDGGGMLAPEVRAVIEDRLGQAGLDVWAPRPIRSGGCF